ncbi:NAD(P)-dependent oxidoreductase [Mycobacterium cookii]|uniref:6-phosphogluconate dehydrogenase n=1 Tax=Mycobacterium cookii TaxID=1775 RepID=A0A7I7KWF8_9MYCO|nr:NAD(P)-dependent oxidoreductase [Mycobacterium cookii]MCV7332253.1 NAD(P)-dependent oxidoreductase [Mycobacterium cookii]BBX46400.1 6-phosphogluconate dehydrogenase [Mycobacterium cookii]
MHVGFIGLGSQGGPMAGRIIDAGFPTTLWARRPESLERYAGTAAKVAASPAELAADSDLVCLCVVGDADVEEVATGEDGVLTGLKPGGIIAIHSTVHPNTCHQLAEKAAAQDVSVIDAPVSGGAPAVAERRLLVMAGGEPDVVDRCRPVFESYADPIVHLGELGSGQTAKLLNNLLFTANLGTAASTLALGEALGVLPDRLTEVISRGSGNSFGLNVLGGDSGLDRLADLAGALLQKDIRLLADLTDRANFTGGAVLDAADATLALMKHPR